MKSPSLPALFVLLAQGALAQSTVPADQYIAAREALIPHDGERTLRCTVDVIAPIVLFTAPEVAGGFTFTMPRSTGFSVTVGFTSATHVQSFLNGRIAAPPAGRDDASGTWSYWMGRGTYSVRVAIADDAGGVCRREWKITVGGWPDAVFPEVDRRTRGLVADPKFHLGTPDDVVRAPSPPAPPTAASPAARITVLVNVPSDSPGQVAVLDGFEALLASLPARSIRLVLFRCEDDGYEIRRFDDFQASSLELVKAEFAPLGFRAVTVAELNAHPIVTPAEELDTLIQRELREAKRSDAVIFLGAERGTESTAKLSALPAGPVPPVSYLHLMRPRPMAISDTGLREGTVPDNLVPFAAKKLNGKILPINLDSEFVQAVERLRKELGK